MGLSKKSNQKANQETQSPVIKVFQDIMHLPDNLSNAEKANVLREKSEKKKKRVGHKPQPEVRYEETSASERRFNPVQRHSISNPKSQSVFQGEKRESWWTWKQCNDKNVEEDTCSCVSCALKKIITQRSGVISVIAVFLALAGAIAIYFLLCSVPKCQVQKKDESNLVRKMRVSDKVYRDRPDWDESKSKLMSGLADLYDADIAESNVQSGNILDASRMNTELSSVLDPNKLSEGYRSSRLRKFYKKLIQTDQQIKNLKKSIREANPSNLDYVSRSKRSLNPGSTARNLTAPDQQPFKDLRIFFPPARMVTVPSQKVKRYINDSGPSSFVIENRKMVLQFKQYPKRHRHPNHLHGVQARLHGNQPSQPFFKPARLDQILTRLIEKNLPYNIFEPFDLSTDAPTRKHSDDGYAFNKDRTVLVGSLAHSPRTQHLKSPTSANFKDVEYYKSRESSTSEATLSMSTIIDTVAKKQLDLIQRVPNIRRLMQVEMEEESDELIANDEKGVRRRRVGPPESYSQSAPKYNPPALHNPNWKGPMPLYPDELDVVKPVYENLPKMVPANNEDISFENLNKNVPVNNEDRDISDTEYVEDYVNNKYDKLVKMAQAYSDYGVLEDKKERNDKSNKALDNRVKLSVQKGLGLLARLKKCKSAAADEGEGIRFEYIPKNREGGLKAQKIDKDMFSWASHLKIMNKAPEQEELGTENTVTDFDFHYTHPVEEKSYKYPSKDENSPFRRHKRSLMSVNEDKAIKDETNDNIRLNISKKSIDKEDDSNISNPTETNSLKSERSSPFSLRKRFFIILNEDFSIKNQSDDDISIDKPIDKDDYPNVDLSKTNSYKSEENQYTLYKRSINDSEPIKEKTDDIKVNITQTIDKEDTMNIANLSKIASLKTEASSFTNEAIKIKKVNVDNKEMIENRTLDNINSTNMILGDIVGLLVNWFDVLTGGHDEDNSENNDNRILTDFLLTMVTPGKVPISPEKYNTENVTKATEKEPMIPNYDSDMVDNIGHRSRVLMSVEEKDNATNINGEKDKSSDEMVTDEEFNITSTTEINKISNATIETINEAVVNKTIKKRSASGNLNFWNDMYDDEYGIKEPLEAIGEKAEPNNKEVPNNRPLKVNWFGMKLKKITQSMRNQKKKEPMDYKEKVKSIFKRNTKSEDSSKQSFKDLTANMKKICREAAQAVHQTRTVGASSQGPSDSEAASTLMQQLVGLMADLVEIQVQQKTCVQSRAEARINHYSTALPPDLRSFLVWLTSPNADSEKKNPQMQTFDEATNMVTVPPVDNGRETTNDIYPDVRTECLGTIHDVEDLIQLYDEMSEEDKSKMSGVREYLENQLDFLHKQLSTFDGYNDVSMSPMQIRKRRQSEPRKPHRKLHKFFKSLGRKRTRSTASFDTFTDNRKTSRRSDVGVEKTNVVTKRNIPDVYYRALNTNATTTGNTLRD